jgi:hypothetical protein
VVLTDVVMKSTVFCLAYSSTLKIEVMCSSETSVDFQRSKRRYVPEDSTRLPIGVCRRSLSRSRYTATFSFTIISNVQKEKCGKLEYEQNRGYTSSERHVVLSSDNLYTGSYRGRGGVEK